jgi:hypothetical protein
MKTRCDNCFNFKTKGKFYRCAEKKFDRYFRKPSPEELMKAGDYCKKFDDMNEEPTTEWLDKLWGVNNGS